MSSQQIQHYIQAFKQDRLPPWRKYLTISYSLLYAAAFTYYIKNYRKYLPKVKGSRSFPAIILKGSQMALLINVGFWGGLLLTSGVNPVSYLRDLSQMQEHLLERSIKHNESLQNYTLFKLMKYFGVSEDVIEKAKGELSQQKQYMLDNKLIQSRDLLIKQPQAEKLHIEVKP